MLLSWDMLCWQQKKVEKLEKYQLLKDETIKLLGIKGGNWSVWCSEQELREVC